jgi:hypothetical protein
MDEFRTLWSESWIELTSKVLWKPYSKSFKEKEDFLVKGARNAAKVQTEQSSGSKVKSLSQLIDLVQRIQSSQSFCNTTNQRGVPGS